jgi:ABC-type nitrate/sulfonate/bicarbonate transport system substrate-binding protein
MNRFQRRLALIGIVLSTCFGAVHESTGQSSTLTAFYTAPVVSMAPMWIAKEVGFFKKQGLDVKLVFIASGPTGTTSCSRGKRMWGSSADLPRPGQLWEGQKIW